MKTEELKDIQEVVAAAMDDIREHLQVAKYNLRGECCGEIMERPNPPQLIHEAGIAASEAVIERLRKVYCGLGERIRTHEEP